MRRLTVSLAVICAAGTPALAQRIACTESAFEQAIASANSGGGGTTITFNCSNTTIPLTASRWANRVLDAPNTIIDGEDRGITFEMSPPWWDFMTTFCGGGNCDPDGNGVPDACPDTGDDGRKEWFMQLNGAGDGIKNVTWRHFLESTQLKGAGAFLDGITCSMPGDDCMSNPNNADIIVRNSTFRDGCDKCIQLYGNNAKGSSGYDSQIINSHIVNCAQPIRLDGPGGRHLVDGTVIEEQNASSSTQCDGPRYTGDGDVHFWKNSVLKNCKRGLRLGGSSEFVSLGGNRFENNELRGLTVYGSAKALVQGDTFVSNGGSSTGGDPTVGYGAVAVGQSGYLDCGGGSSSFDGSARTSAGGNTFDHNESPADTRLDVLNLGTTTVKAENNWWLDSDPADQIGGLVDFTPALSGPPGGGTDPNPPAAVTSLRRVDRN